MKRKFTFLELLIVLAILLTVLLGAWQFASAQTVYTKIDKDSDIPVAFDHTLLDVAGQPVVVDAAEFVFRIEVPGPDPAPPNRELIVRGVIVGPNVYLSREVIASIPIGRYLMTARVRSDAGAFSAESNVVAVEVTAKKPAAPLRLRVGGP